jgi:hypothetical protein
MNSFSVKGFVGAMAMAVVMVGCGGQAGAGKVSKTQAIGVTGGVIDLKSVGLQISVPAGAVSQEIQVEVAESEHAGSHRSFEVHSSGTLEHAARLRFSRPEGTSGKALKVMHVDDHGNSDRLVEVSEAEHQAEVEPGDDKSWQESVDVDSSSLEGSFELDDDDGVDPAPHA